ncbi:uncharacterized protein [Triticum aestivum]|uniref:uncharacterized protein n=1 Tax=Triticum aestivum TaxID=4565 RepID=UPI001D01DE3E|nr:uncharacterized protein LOC123178757 [Triticum aestivum]
MTAALRLQAAARMLQRSPAEQRLRLPPRRRFAVVPLRCCREALVGATAREAAGAVPRAPRARQENTRQTPQGHRLDLPHQILGSARDRPSTSILDQTTPTGGGFEPK